MLGQRIGGAIPLAVQQLVLVGFGLLPLGRDSNEEAGVVAPGRADRGDPAPEVPQRSGIHLTTVAARRGQADRPVELRTVAQHDANLFEALARRGDVVGQPAPLDREFGARLAIVEAGAVPLPARVVIVVVDRAAGVDRGARREFERRVTPQQVGGETAPVVAHQVNRPGRPRHHRTV